MACHPARPAMRPSPAAADHDAPLCCGCLLRLARRDEESRGEAARKRELLPVTAAMLAVMVPNAAIVSRDTA
eukprot:gene32183-31571_t